MSHGSKSKDKVPAKIINSHWVLS